MGKLGITEIVVILLIVLLLFGGKKIPQIMRGIGQGINEFKKVKNSKSSDSTATRNNHQE